MTAQNRRVVSPLFRYHSLFSGAEAASCALEALKAHAKPVTFAEIDPAACAFLETRFPEVTNVGDIRNADYRRYRGQADCVFGGPPCQPFSDAGEREHLNDPRGQLLHHFLRVLVETRVQWFAFENVPGLLNREKGLVFSWLCECFEAIGYSIACRILDAKYFGVPQSRRRVWIVGYLGGPASIPEQVLFDQEDDHRACPPCPQAWLAATAPARRRTRGHIPPEAGQAEAQRHARQLGNMMQDPVSSAALGSVADGPGRMDQNSQSYPGVAVDFRHNKLTGDATHTLQAKSSGGYSLHFAPGLILPEGGLAYESGMGFVRETEVAGPLRAASGGRTANLHFNSEIVRRLTPLEQMRLQGFPDTWFDGVMLKGRPLTDTHICRLMGNSWSVPQAAWVIERLLWVQGLLDDGYIPPVDCH